MTIELADIPAQTRERIEQIGAADLVLGIPRAGAAQDVQAILADTREALSKLYSPVQTLVIHGGEPIEAAPGPVRTVAMPMLSHAGNGADPLKIINDAYHAVFTVGQNLRARAVVVLVSDVESITPQWIYGLARPVLELDFDLVTPCYEHAPFEGLVTAGIVTPLTRALYGRRVRHPLGPDFGFSGRLIERLLDAANPRTHPRSIASLAVDAICDGFEICEANVGVRRYPPVDWSNQSSVLARILSPVFLETEFHAAQWQRVRGSQPVPVFGEAGTSRARAETIDVRRMIDSFALGYRNLEEIWSAILPPGTLLELSKLAKGPRELFHMPDRTWARILYDFALGHRLRLINPDHLIRAMTPLYLAWVASFALDAAVADAAVVARRLEDLALAFEAAKPYLVSRWRWPDRFHP
jgi:glucosylglycerate synthase